MVPVRSLSCTAIAGPPLARDIHQVCVTNHLRDRRWSGRASTTRMADPTTVFSARRLYKDLLKACALMARQNATGSAEGMKSAVRAQFKANMHITDAEQAAKCREDARRALVNFAAHQMGVGKGGGGAGSATS